MSILKDKRIIVGITGGIAVYKIATLVSLLVKAGAIVDVVMTDAATRFVGPATFEALTHRQVYTDMFDNSRGTFIPHVNLARAADLMVVAPATGNTLAKFAFGIADNLLTSVILAHDCPVILVPAMESHMWGNPATQENLEVLKKRGFYVAGPDSGRLASGREGVGRMIEPEEIFGHIRYVSGKTGDLCGKTIVITSGGTREAIDPVRFIGNNSSGKMGAALALAARDRGAEVKLITSGTLKFDSVGMEIQTVTSAEEMCEAVMSSLINADVLIKAAAVADYRPVKAAQGKIKKSSDNLTIDLEKTTDILAKAGEIRNLYPRLKVIAGFAAETENLIENASEKLRNKKIDLIVANPVNEEDCGFGSDKNKAVIIGKDNNPQHLPLMSKEELAHRILDRIKDLPG
jgi:phosphopantothenoylcysteine decarboxylase / phosphopantothenate---cysteine ligase